MKTEALSFLYGRRKKMKVVIESTNWQGRDDILRHYPFLLNYNFESKDIEWSGQNITVCYIHIASLEELLRLKEQCDEELVITNCIYTDEISIEIYDGYRE